MAVLCILAGEVKHHGVCDLPIDKIAALAGVCRTTVQTTLHEARRLLHIEVIDAPRPGGKHLPNEEFASFLANGARGLNAGLRPSPRHQVRSLTWSKKVSTTKNADLRGEVCAR